MSENVVLEVKNLSVLIKDRFLVKNANFTLKEGECWGIIGQDKSGKTSLIKAISGTLPINPGQVFMLGKDIYYDKKILTKVSTCFDPPVFFKYQTVYENLKYMCMLNDNDSKVRIYRILNKFGLVQKMKTRVIFLSYYEKKLMSIALGLITKPKILLLDEPYKNLPEDSLKIVKEAITKVQAQGTTVVITSENIESIEDLCDNFIFMENRAIKSFMTKEECKKLLAGTTYAYVKVKYPHFVGKLIMDNFNLNVKLLDRRVLFEADETTSAQIVRFITKHNLAIYKAGYINKKADIIFANLTPYFKEEQQ